MREAEQRDKDREQHAAHDRIRDVVFRQNTDATREQRPREQDQAGRQQRRRARKGNRVL